MMAFSMRIATMFSTEPANASYRAQMPVSVLAMMGHDVAPAEESLHTADPRELVSYDLVHVFRLFDTETRRKLEYLKGEGVAVCWDQDDDISGYPEEGPMYEQVGGAIGKWMYAEGLKLARLADVVTTPSQTLAEKFRGAGAHDVRVIENYIHPVLLEAEPQPHEGIVIGWTAGLEHRADLTYLPIVAALERILERHKDVRVVSVALDLEIQSDRYTCSPAIGFLDLAEQAAQWDIAIAPIADIPFNRTRSNIKLKEYAAAGVPWLASPVGAYADMGEQQGGLLVPDDGWYEALDDLIRHRRKRKRLGKQAKRWATEQSMLAAGRLWEQAFMAAIERANERQPR
jgi:glycosyltransferase involved in cell wall biosynthesis